MKKIYTLFIAIISFSSAIAQNANAVVFSELGEKFTLYLNGVQINATPQANVKATALSGEFCQARIDFEDASKADFAENNFRLGQGLEVTYIVKLNKKGAYVLRFAGEAAITNTSAVATGASKIDDNVKKIAEVDDHVAVPMDTEVKTTTTNTTAAPKVDNKVTVVETTTTTTNTKPAPAKTGEKVNMGINVGGINMGVNVNVEETGDDVNMDMGMDVQENTKVTTTTTTTKTTTNGTTTGTTATSTSTGTKPAVTTTTTKPAVTGGKPALPTTKPPVAVPDNKPTEVVVIEKTGGCANVMSDATFASAKKNISGKGFEDTKLSTAKSIAKVNCMSAAQIKEVCGIFGFEDSKLEFAKYCYDYCYDQNNYFIVNEAFNFSDSTDELNKYIESK
jgi:hypothetical protein